MNKHTITAALTLAATIAWTPLLRGEPQEEKVRTI